MLKESSNPVKLTILIQEIAERLNYAKEWAESHETHSYGVGAIEAAAFTASCELCQKTTLFPDGLATSDLITEINYKNIEGITKIHKNLLEFILKIQSEKNE